MIEEPEAAAKDEPYAVPLDFPVAWDVGAPLPVVFATDSLVFLTFLTADEKHALVEFHSPESLRFGSPNEDVHVGHYLSGRGQEAYTAQIVENSPWLREVEAMNKTHPQYDAERWRRVKHYVFWFHDSTFECLARGYKVEILDESMVEKILKRLL